MAAANYRKQDLRASKIVQLHPVSLNNHSAGFLKIQGVIPNRSWAERDAIDCFVKDLSEIKFADQQAFSQSYLEHKEARFYKFSRAITTDVDKFVAELKNKHRMVQINVTHSMTKVRTIITFCRNREEYDSIERQLTTKYFNSKFMINLQVSNLTFF